MKRQILRNLKQQDLITSNQAEQISQYEANKPFSLHWELKTGLYLGVLLLNIGLGWLIYENIDTIGHTAIIALIGAICGGSFWYSYLHRVPFSTARTESPSPFYDYIVLLGCFTFLILEGYLQFQYNLFGEKYGLATFIPMVLFLSVAYYFDHRGALSLAITALASWLGIAVTPAELFSNNDFSNGRLIYTGLVLGTVLCGAAFFLNYKDIKKHFSFTYLNFGANILFVSCIAGLMALDMELLFTALLAIVTAVFIWYAKQEQSFYFLTLSVLYAYWGVSYLVFQIDALRSELIFIYFIFSCGGIIFFLLRYKKILHVSNK
jgi:hypothetical protein